MIRVGIGCEGVEEEPLEGCECETRYRTSPELCTRVMWSATTIPSYIRPRSRNDLNYPGIYFVHMKKVSKQA